MLIDQQVEAGCVEGADAYLAGAVRRNAEGLEAEDEIIAEAGLASGTRRQGVNSRSSVWKT